MRASVCACAHSCVCVLCVCVNTCVSVCISVCVYDSECVYACVHACVCVNMCVCMCACMHVCVCECVCVCVCICMCVCICVCVANIPGHLFLLISVNVDPSAHFQRQELGISVGLGQVVVTATDDGLQQTTNPQVKQLLSHFCDPNTTLCYNKYPNHSRSGLPSVF